MFNLGDAIRSLRERLGLSQRAAADEVGISHVHLNNLENGKAAPTTSMLEKFYEAWGIDIYMYAVLLSGDYGRLPSSLVASAKRLSKVWEKEIAAALRRRSEVKGSGC